MRWSSFFLHMNLVSACSKPATDYATGAQIGQDEGLTLLYAAASSPDEWDHFEGSFAARRYRLAYSLASVEARNAAIERTRRWHNAYLRWGRDTMGFRAGRRPAAAV